MKQAKLRYFVKTIFVKFEKSTIPTRNASPTGTIVAKSNLDAAFSSGSYAQRHKHHRDAHAGHHAHDTGNRTAHRKVNHRFTGRHRCRVNGNGNIIFSHHANRQRKSKRAHCPCDIQRLKTSTARASFRYDSRDASPIRPIKSR